MKRFLKYLPVTLLVTIMAIGLATCKDDDDEPTQGNDQSIVGTWRADFNYGGGYSGYDQVTFTADGHVHEQYSEGGYTGTDDGTYTAQNGRLTITWNSIVEEGKDQNPTMEDAYSINGNTLTVGEVGLMEYVYTRVN